VLARTDTNIPGTKGLSIFLVEKYLPSGGRNPLDIIRLKDKLGVRSMASGECVLNGTRATLVGKEFEGFKIMAEMMNLSRIYNSVAAVSAGRRALIEAYQFLRHRVSFGQAAVGHSLVRMKLEELSARYTACFYMTWRAIEAMDRSENGNKPEMELLRLLTPMVKKFTAESGVYLVRECMELMGGIGYIEDQVMPRIMRDVMVLPIWEGAGNIMVLDMLRALGKSEGFALLCAEVTEVAQGNTDFGTGLLKEMEEIIVLKDALNGLERATLEASAGRFFERLTNLYRDTLLLKALRPETAQWIRPSLSYFRSRQMATGTINPLSVEEINGMIAWG
jgi:acyl-CoA dehydrogenase